MWGLMQWQRSCTKVTGYCMLAAPSVYSSRHGPIGFYSSGSDHDLGDYMVEAAEPYLDKLAQHLRNPGISG